MQILTDIFTFHFFIKSALLTSLRKFPLFLKWQQLLKCVIQSVELSVFLFFPRYFRKFIVIVNVFMGYINVFVNIVSYIFEIQYHKVMNNESNKTPEIPPEMDHHIMSYIYICSEQ